MRRRGELGVQNRGDVRDLRQRQQPELAEQQAQHGSGKPVSSQADMVRADLRRTRKQGPADPDRMVPGETNILAARNSISERHADAVSINQKGSCLLHRYDARVAGPWPLDKMTGSPDDLGDIAHGWCRPSDQPGDWDPVVIGVQWSG